MVLFLIGLSLALAVGMICLIIVQRRNTRRLQAQLVSMHDIARQEARREVFQACLKVHNN